MNNADIITAQREAFVKAFHSEDISTMSKLVTQDHLIMAPNHSEMTGLEAAQEFWRSGFSIAKTKMEMETQDIAVIDNLAIDRFHWTQQIKLHDTGDLIEDKGKCIWMWRCEDDGSWRLEVPFGTVIYQMPGPGPEVSF